MPGQWFSEFTVLITVSWTACYSRLPFPSDFRVRPGICISNKFPGDVDAAGLGTILEEPLYQTQP